MESFQPLLNFFAAQKAVIGYCVMAVITVGGEHLFSVVSFECPCSKENFEYGMTFLLGPAAVLLILGLFFSATFYECAASGMKANCLNETEDCLQELVKLPCDKSNGKERILGFKAHAQMMALFLIIGAAIVFSCIRFCSQDNSTQRMYKKHYARELRERFDAFVVEEASKKVKQQIQKIQKDIFNWKDSPSYSSLLKEGLLEEDTDPANVENEHEKEGQDESVLEEDADPANETNNVTNPGYQVSETTDTEI